METKKVIFLHEPMMCLLSVFGKNNNNYNYYVTKMVKDREY